MPHLTSIAGRHAADRERERAAQALLTPPDDCELQAAARDRLARVIRMHGLEACARFEDVLGPERTLKVDCRLASCANDQRLVYAILDDQRWRPDDRKRSVISARYHVLRVRHRDCGAQLAVVIGIPNSEVTQWEAA